MEALLLNPIIFIPVALSVVAVIYAIGEVMVKIIKALKG